MNSLYEALFSPISLFCRI